MRDYFRFWWRCVVWAFAGWERGQSLADLFIALARLLPLVALPASFILARFPSARIGAAADLSPLLGWLSVAYLTVLLLVRAPYAVWRQERDRADAAEARLGVRLSLRGEVRNEGGKVASLVVRNLGSSHVASCSGELKAVYKLVDGRREQVPDVYPLYLRWSRRYQPEASPKLTFNTTAELEVLRLPDQYTGWLEVRSFDQRRGGMQLPSGIFWLPEAADFVFVVEVSAENCAPVMAECSLNLQPLGQHATRGPGGDLETRPLPDIAFEVRDAIERREAE